jgi:hypothetical protein
MITLSEAIAAAYASKLRDKTNNRSKIKLAMKEKFYPCKF